MKRDINEVGSSERAEQELDVNELEGVSGGASINYALASAQQFGGLQPIRVVFNPGLGSIIGGVARRC